MIKLSTPLLVFEFGGIFTCNHKFFYLLGLYRLTTFKYEYAKPQIKGEEKLVVDGNALSIECKYNISILKCNFYFLVSRNVIM